jgi:energy-coupling factor transporter ATP-binding protein EcfA2
MIPAIEIKNLHFRYHDGTHALRGINLTIHDGEYLGIVGPNGAGKSTLLHHCNGLLPETFRGEPCVSVYGVGITKESLLTIHQTVGLLFQNPDDQLFCPTVFEDVAFGPQQFGKGQEEIREIVRNALAKVRLEEYETKSPHHLSGGEKQRICLAGILACSPRILVLDEPTKDLDPRGRRELITLLREIHSTLIIASHDLEMIVELCARTVVLDQGRIVADGPTKQLLADEQLMHLHGLETPHSLTHPHK